MFLPGKSEPGLAVARAFGDFDLKLFGVTSTPDVKVQAIEEERDGFVVLASDGVRDREQAKGRVGKCWGGRVPSSVLNWMAHTNLRCSPTP